MSSGKGHPTFPDVEAKLQKPTKQSAFERQKAEAEAKRKREAAETAAVYADFVKSFDRDDDDDRRDAAAPSSFGGPSRGKPGFGGGPPPGHGASRRHFVSSGLKSGPGSLGPSPSAFTKKRSFNDFKGGSRDRAGLLGFEEPESGSAATTSVAKAFNASDEEDMGDSRDRAEEKATSKPTLRLTNLPPGTSPAVVKALIPDTLNVENVKIQPPAPSGPGGSERKCTIAIVTLSQETPANEMDTAVSTLQNRYLGYGYYLSLHRHLSSAVAASANLPSLTSSSSGAHPFGAKPVEQPGGRDKPSHHQQGFHRGFAPPSSYGQVGVGVNRSQLLHVPVRPPQDVRTIQLINKTIEGVLEYGPQFEALLMSRPDVQREERWAWIWDARSEGGIWYRWRLWQVVTGSEFNQVKGKYVPLFDGGDAWKSPEKNLVFEYTTSLDEFVSDPEYNSSDDEDMDDATGDNNVAEMEKRFLSPLDKAKLVHLLARLPTTLGKLRKGDIARVTTFAITHASRGADEVVDMIVANVEKPLSLTGANPEKKHETKPNNPTTSTDEATANDGLDTSGASLVALYVVSDVLSSSSTSGVRHAWRFRQLFETALRERKVFERLGMMAEKLGWGRLRAEKWKRSINLVLNLWEGWCVFPAESQELFVRTFESPPSLKAEDKAEESSFRSKWKVVDALPAAKSDTSATAAAADGVHNPAAQDDVDGEPLDEDDVMGEPIDDEDVEGEPIEEDDVAGEPIDEDELETEFMEQDGDGAQTEAAPPQTKSRDEDERAGAEGGQESAGRSQQRKRLRAVDMFADSDDSGTEK
ncbi:RNA polymerase II, large subunit, CTD [Pochonia chlamydosporia 170]|uniref:RNA polymerase II, large subunit, CTD n=1 Tax=Pochonia chlamydosporia 170 TaxID=1380566 RepID=A0A179G7Q4_METCM|nr:RNA polymerase II, large subunit, CTD [Pochonia chlamydosporia 170]OAQ73822.1 RNA polymerase II, large subunit, CTD [Pochonia chlamydosporia 170]